MRLRTASVVGLIVTVMLIAAPAAVGLEPGVHVDPHSPSGTEYSFPLGSTRQQLGGGSSAGASAGSGPLFGVGLGRATGHRHTSGAHTGGRHHAGARSSRESGSRHDVGALRREQTEAIAALSQSGSGVDALTLVVAVLALGGAGGLGLWLIARRRRAGDR